MKRPPESPKCLFCGKTLQKLFLFIQVEHGTTPDTYTEVDVSHPWYGRHIFETKGRRTQPNYTVHHGAHAKGFGNPIPTGITAHPPKWDDLKVWFGEFIGSRKSAGNYFCSDRCGVAFADACVRSGYRLKTKEKV